MSKTAAVKFAETILQLFPPFRWEPDQEDRWMEIMARETSGFSDRVLEQALSNIVRRKEHRIPTVGECIEACCEAKRWLEQDKAAGELPDLHPSASRDWSTERRKLAHDSIQTEMGREAARDGWIGSLWNFVREQQRLPKGQEVEGCKRQAKEFLETYEMVLRGECVDKDGVVQKLPKAEAAVLQKLGASMLARREEWASEVLGRVPR